MPDGIYFHSNEIMTTTPSGLFGSYHSPYDALLAGPIERLRRQRIPDAKPKKPKPVTDEQLLGVVDELQAKIDRLTKEIAAARTEAGQGDRAIRRDIENGYRLRLSEETRADYSGPETAQCATPSRG